MTSAQGCSFRAALSALVAAAVALGSATAGAYTRGESNWNPAALPIRYRVNANSAPASIGPDGARMAVDAAFASWSAPACTRWRSQNDGASSLTRARAGDGENSVLWISGSWPPELGDVRSTIGVTTPQWRVGGYFIDADIQFNNVGFRWSLTGASGTVDTQSIALHEEGHFLGLNHSSLSRAIMYASYSGGQRRTLDADDVSGVCAIYPSGMAPPDAGVAPDSGTPGSGTVGDRCGAGAPCATGHRCVCTSSGSCFCTRPCGASAPCPSGYACQPTSIGQICVPSGMTMPGTGQTGDPCTSPDQCASGVCVRTSATATSGICTRVCTDDCTCPSAYTCTPTSQPGTNVCIAGTNRCTTNDDAGVIEVDAGAEEDAAVEADAGDGGAADADGGGVVGGAPRGLCGCRVPGAPAGGGAWGLLAVGAVLAAMRRGRRRR